MKAPGFFLVLCVLVLTACGSAPAPTPLASVTMDFTQAAGRAPGLHSAGPFGYWIWRDDDGSWHLRTTSGRQGHRFQGRIRSSEPGAIQAVAGIGLEAPGRKRRGGADHYRIENGEIVFDFATKSSIDGLDFQLVGNSCVDFDLRIDGDGDAGKIHIGKSAVQPTKPRVIFCPK